MSHWAVVQTKSGRENTAEENLRNQGYRTFLPKYISQEGKKKVIRMLFPRYMFVYIQDTWHSINNTYGVSKLLMTTNDNPSIVPDKVIAELKSRCDSKGYVVLPEKEKFSIGEKVFLDDPNFKCYGIYNGMKSSDRVNVLIDILGRCVTVDVDSKSISVAVLKEENG